MGVVYGKLTSKDEIRLLRLLPGSGSEPLKCIIFHARLGESPTYDALSYMWGIDRPGEKFLLEIDNGRVLEVQENLSHALSHMRLRDRERVLWVDAICINQADDEERGHQVSQMGRIYSQATTVRLWLGLADENSRTAFQFLNNNMTVKKLDQGIVPLNDCAAVANLCMRSYWQRLWIIQEIVLAARIHIHCGEMAIHWDYFSDALFAFERGLHRFETCVMPRHADFAVAARIVDSPAMKICRQRQTNIESSPTIEPTSLLSLVWIHKDAKCVDIRDKIFGTHSFAPECCRACIPVDYTCSAYTLCRRVLEHDILCHSHGKRNGGRESVVRRSLDLHGLIIKGALSQALSLNSFRVGAAGHLDEEDESTTLNAQIPSPIIVLGHQTGRIAFVTPPLISLFMEEGPLMVPRAMVTSFGEMRFGCENVDNPILTSRMTKALGKIWRSKEMDIIPRSRTSGAGNLEMIDLNSNTHEDLATHGMRTFLNFCSEFLRASTFLSTNPAYEDCVMYFSIGGSGAKIGFAPVGTQRGDSLCTFTSTTLIAVVRKTSLDNTIVGQGSVVEEHRLSSIEPQVGNVLNIQLDLALLQMFSKIVPACEMPDYRVVLTIPPRMKEGRTHRLRGIRHLTEVLRVPSEMAQGFVVPSSAERSESSSFEERRPPKYTTQETATLLFENSRARSGVGGSRRKKYACPRCSMKFDTSKDNLLHAATWSHCQCTKCHEWKSWKATGRAMSTKFICCRCLPESPGD